MFKTRNKVISKHQFIKRPINVDKYDEHPSSITDSSDGSQDSVERLELLESIRRKYGIEDILPLASKINSKLDQKTLKKRNRERSYISESSVGNVKNITEDEPEIDGLRESLNDKVQFELLQFKNELHLDKGTSTIVTAEFGIQCDLEKLLVHDSNHDVIIDEIPQSDQSLNERDEIIEVVEEELEDINVIPEKSDAESYPQQSSHLLDHDSIIDLSSVQCTEIAESVDFCDNIPDLALDSEINDGNLLSELLDRTPVEYIAVDLASVGDNDLTCPITPTRVLCYTPDAIEHSVIPLTESSLNWIEQESEHCKRKITYPTNLIVVRLK